MCYFLYLVIAFVQVIYFFLALVCVLLLSLCSFGLLNSILLWIYTGLRLCFSMLSLYVSHFLLFLELLPFVFFILFFWHIIICFSLLVIDSLDHQDMFLNSVTAECISCTWVWHLNCFVLFSFFFSPFCCCSTWIDIHVGPVECNDLFQIYLSLPHVHYVAL